MRAGRRWHNCQRQHSRRKTGAVFQPTSARSCLFDMFLPYIVNIHPTFAVMSSWLSAPCHSILGHSPVSPPRKALGTFSSPRADAASPLIMKCPNRWPSMDFAGANWPAVSRSTLHLTAWNNHNHIIWTACHDRKYQSISVCAPSDIPH